MLIESFIFFIFIVDISHRILYNIIINNIQLEKENPMSDVQQAIEELVTEQVESRIDDAISDNYTINDIRSDVDDLQSRLNDDIVNDVVKEVITKLISSIDGDYVMVKRSHLEDLKTKATESKNVA